ncbi:MAG: DUF3566 domain-containing protein [Rubrivivax sp.]|nr:DUF3566 domain-containing protein [Pyrinomonadaceae bacterium]
MAKMQVKRVGIFSYAKISAVTCAAFGLIFGVIYGLIFMIVGGAMMAGGGRDASGAGAGSMVIGLLAMIGIPIFYGVLGFIVGAIGGVIYNVAAGFVGGLELELEPVANDYDTPPQPQWNASPPNQPGQQQYPY